ncbi:transporter substrate-binding domain-containing protein [Chitinasiproducens palmae]|uniref:Amino acid ABC transporter substrate-binding protein, PAAT family n=1 Tax=Chitinasiproducens palmae TaxID=1770053 RepID=A0A1H2PPP7_9BURK|nr:transporter substrate-binding domain-containing protein [Chitinasiproducens palmae]SDV48726.1 amino acid ABC transporter substrate-binding protein, PAAT family [Chitinasiproducens palmae]
MSDIASRAALLAPTGVLRASINLGNPLLASRGGPAGATGVSVDLATELAARLGTPLSLVVVESARESVERVAGGDADIGFFAVDPKRAEDIAFTAPYLLIEGAYLVPAGSALRSLGEVDDERNRVVTATGSAYDLFLTRSLQHARIERVTESPNVVDAMVASGAEVAAGVRQQLERDAARIGGLRLLPGRFMVIPQAMGVARARDPKAAVGLAQFVEEMKASGFVAAALARHRIDGGSVAPRADRAPT